MPVLGLYPTKKALKEAIGQTLRFEETSIAGPEYQPNGTFVVVGPSRDYEKWAADVTMKDGKIVEVR